MKYSGRITITALLFSFICMNVPFYYPDFNVTILLIHLFYLAIFWALGWKFDKTIYIAENDELTSVYNRRYISSTIDKLLKKMIRHNEKVCVIVVDLNNFKLLNDEFGHVFGDYVLKNVATILKQSVKKGGLVARWGGDEFILILPRTELEEALELKSVIQLQLQQLSKSYRATVSASIGISVFPSDATTLEDLIHVADSHMYSAKREKKDQPVFS
ncbi:GGDEF domain-containing protein [Brevibacillus sp. SYSU BS000544]|uniref:GGDEF domain-containing protein n=1 Tax=Brevibacillus sp. SYSU BS000544 TaxID=3416443 RepID=UPI003CE551FC